SRSRARRSVAVAGSLVPVYEISFKAKKGKEVMPLTRRDFLISGSLSLAAGAFSPLVVRAEQTKPSTPVDFKDWESVRREFKLAPDYVHLALFFLASHP